MSPRRRKLRLAVVPVSIDQNIISRLTDLFESCDEVSFTMESHLKKDKNAIQTKLMILCNGGDNDDDDTSKFDAVLTLGGIGCLATDVVPEATTDVIQRSLPALSHFFHRRCDIVSLRPVFGMRDGVIIGNLPGPEDIAGKYPGDGETSLIMELTKFVIKKITRIFDSLHHQRGLSEESIKSKRRLMSPEEEEEVTGLDPEPILPGISEEEEGCQKSDRISKVIPFKSETISDDDDDTIIFEHDGEQEDSVLFGDYGDDRDLPNYIIDSSTEAVASTCQVANCIGVEDDNIDTANCGVIDFPDSGITEVSTRLTDKKTGKGQERLNTTTGPIPVDVGKPLFNFFKTHPLTKGVVLNRNKRHIKRDLACVKPKKTRTKGEDSSFSVTAENWTRNGKVMKKNWLDDEFELTPAGLELWLELEDDGGGVSGRKRNTPICTWYLSCPGTSTCKRECGGVGACLPGCRGKTSKQNRHNCQLMVKMQIFLRDLTKWVVSFHGRHNETNSLPSAADRRLFGDEEKRVLNSLIANDKVTCKKELLRRLKRHYRENDVQLSGPQTRRLFCFIDRFWTKRS